MPGVLEELLSSVGGFKIYSSTDVALAVADAVVKCFSEAEDLLEAARSVLALVEGLALARPTSVISLNVARRLVEKAEALVKAGEPRERVAGALAAESSALKRELESSIAVAAALGARRVRDGSTLMTCSYSKSVKALFSRLKSEGKRVRAIVAESRPGGEGVAMAEEIGDMGFETELVVDSAVRFFMKDVDAVVVGAEAIAANGAVINKVGTSLIALAAHEARVRFYVATETYKFSPATILGELVTIEERAPEEVVPTDLLTRHPNLKVRNPAFDVTPPDYIDAIITERGVIPPKAAAVILLEDYGATLAEELATMDIEDSAA